jgi:putative membrane protein
MASGGDTQTNLAVERTQLAWWRTGLTALAVGVGIGRIVPDLGHSATHWPYAVLGVAFCAYGLCLIAYGYQRAGRTGSVSERPGSFALAAFGVVLSLATIVLIVTA